MENKIELENKLNSQSREFDEMLAQVIAMANKLQQSWSEARKLHGKALEKGDSEESIDFEEAISMVAKYKSAKDILNTVYTITRIYE